MKFQNINHYINHNKHDYYLCWTEFEKLLDVLNVDVDQNSHGEKWVINSQMSDVSTD